MKTSTMRPRPSSSSLRRRAAGLGLALAATLAIPVAAAAPPPDASSAGSADSAAPSVGARAADAPAPPTFSVPALRQAAERHASRGEVGEAVLAYERAAWLAPRDEGIARGLAAARAAAGLPAAAPAPLQSAARLLAVGEATHLAAIALWVAVFAAIASVTVRRRRGLLAATAAGALAMSVAAAASVAVRAPMLDAAVALEPATLGIAPFEGSEAVTPLPEGARLEVHDRHGTFVRVKTATGAEGWVDASRVASIVL